MKFQDFFKVGGIITKGSNSNSIGPLALIFLLLVFVLIIGMCLQGLMKFHQ